MTTFGEYCLKKEIFELLKASGISSDAERRLYEHSISLLEEGLLDSTKKALGKAGGYLKKAIDMPENIAAGIHKAYRVMKSTAFLAALVYMGFRFEAIRALFPWLAPVIDQMGEAVLSAGKSFLASSFGWLSRVAKDVVLWLANVVKEGLSNSSPMPETPGGPSILDPGWMLPDHLKRLGHQGA